MADDSTTDIGTSPVVGSLETSPVFGQSIAREPAPVETIPVTISTVTDGSLDPTQQPDSVPPLNEISAHRIAAHAEAALTPNVSPINDIPQVKPNGDISKDMRWEYSQALQKGETDGPQDFAERVAGTAYSVAQDALPNVPPDPGEHASLTNAATALAGALPTHEDLIDSSIALSHSVYGDATPNSVAVIKSNLLDQWTQTGQSIPSIVRQAMQDSDLAAQLASPPPTPWQQSPQFPTPQELAETPQTFTPAEVAEAAPALGIVPKLAESIRSALGPGILAEEAEHDAKVQLLMKERGLKDTSLVPADIQAKAGLSPITSALGIGGMLGPAEAAADVHQAVVRDALGRMFPTVRTPAARKLAGAVKRSIQKEVGTSKNISDIFRDMMQEFQKPVNKLMPEHRRFEREMQSYVQARTAAKETWIADGNHPDAFQEPTTLVRPLLSQIQALYDHMEARPGGGRLAPDHPLFPLAEVLQSAMTSMRHEIERNFNVERFVENYVSHKYEDPDAFTKAFGSSRRGDPSAFNRRTIPTLYDAMLRGLKSKFPNPIENAAHYIQGMSDYLASERVIRTGVENGQMIWGREAPYDGWVELNNVTRRPEWEDRTEAMQAQLRIGADFDRSIPMAHQVEGPGGPAQTALPRNTLKSIGHNGGPPIHDGLKQLEGPEVAAEKTATSPYSRRRLPDIEKLWAHPATARPYNNWSGVGFRRWAIGGDIVDNLTAAANASTALHLMLTGAHLFNIAHAVVDSGLANGLNELVGGTIRLSPKEIGRGLADMGMSLTLFPRLAADLYKGHQGQLLYLGKVADMTPIQQTVRKLLIEANARPLGRGMEMDIGRSRNLFTAWRNGGLTERLRENATRGITVSPNSITPGADRLLQGAVYSGARLFGDIAHTLSSPLFDWAIPKLKLAASMNEIETYIRQHPLATEDELTNFAHQTIASKDDIYGELNSENVFIPRAAKQIATATLLSQSWWYGTMRAFGRGASDILHLRNTARARWLLSSLITYTYLSSLVQHYMTGRGPQNFADVAHPPTGGAQPSLSNSNQTVQQRAAWLNPYKEGDDFYSIGFAITHSSDPFSTAVNKLEGYVFNKGNPLARAMITLLTSGPGTEWRDQILQDVAPMLASQQQQVKGNAIPPWMQWIGFHSAGAAIADPEGLAKILNTQDAKQQNTLQWKRYYEDQRGPNPTLARPPSWNAVRRKMPHG